MLTVLSLRAAAGDVIITSHGAVGDGKVLNTPFIQRAIDACHDSGAEGER